MGSGTRFSWQFSGHCYMIFCLFLWCPWLNWYGSWLVWFKRSLHSAQVSGHIIYPWPLKLITSQAVETKWIRMGGSGRLRGEWVEVVFFLRFSVFIFIKISPKMSISWGKPIQVWNRKWYMYLKHCFLSRLIQAVVSLFSVTCWVTKINGKFRLIEASA